jgi:Xaa-Pro aminopeptidase
MNLYQQRIARLQQAMQAEGLCAAVFAPTDNMRYLTGWAEPGHERLIALFVPAQGDPAFVLTSLNVEQARHNPAGIADVRAWHDATGWQETVRQLLAERQIEGVIAVDDEMQSVHLLGLQQICPQARYTPAGDLMASLRQIKTSEELDALSRSAAVTDAVYAECLPQLREGMTERELQEIIAQAYKRRGTAPAFAIVCFGPNSALPHHHTGETRLKHGDIVILDIGCVIDGYYSDITRTLAFGEPEPEAKRVYEIVYRAHRAAFDAVRPGQTCETVDRAARAVIEQEGYGQQFIHRTGHGIGLSGHEPPSIVAGNAMPLQTTMCFSVEPGIYLPGRFGVRIENIVTVTETGARYLNADPPATLPIVG